MVALALPARLSLAEAFQVEEEAATEEAAVVAAMGEEVVVLGANAREEEFYAMAVRSFLQPGDCSTAGVDKKEWRLRASGAGIRIL